MYFQTDTMPIFRLYATCIFRNISSFRFGFQKHYSYIKEKKKVMPETIYTTTDGWDCVPEVAEAVSWLDDVDTDGEYITEEQ